MADVTGRIGDQDVALDNAATEATLKDILAAMKGQASALSKLTGTAGQAGVNPQAIASANKGIQQMGAASTAGSVAGKLLNMAMGGLSKGAMLLGGVLGDIVAGGVQTGKNLMDLAGKMLDGGGKVSDVFGAFKDLPLGIGAVAGLFEKLMQMQQAELETYRELTKSGVNLGGTLTDVRATALSMGTTLEGFGKLVKENSTLFAQLGGSVNDGAKNFVNLAKDIRNSDVGKNLRALGYSIDDINSSTASYLKMTGGRTAEEMKNTKALAASAGAYMSQLDMLASITGKSREEEEKKLQAAAANVAWEAKMQSMSEEERAKANAALANAMSVGGQGAVDALQARMMGIPPMTEAGQMFEAMSRNASAALSKQAAAVTDSTKSLKDIEKGYGEMLAGSAQDAKNLGKEQIAAMTYTGGVQAEVALNAQKNANMMHSKNLKNAEDVNKLQGEIAANADARSKSSAAKAAEAEEAFKKLTSELYQALMPVLAELTPIVTDLGTQMIEFARQNMPAIKEGLKMVVDFVKNLFSPEGREKVGKQIAEGLGKLLQMAWDNFSLFGKKKQPDADSAAYSSTGYDSGSIPGAADGGILKAKTGGQLVRAAEVGMNEAFVPLPDGNKIPVNLDMKMPQMTDLAKEFQSFKSSFDEQLKKSTGSSTADIGEMFSGIKDNLFGKSKDSSNAGQDMSSKDLLVELQTLNKQTAQMISFMRETTDFSRRNLDAIRGLSGNLLI
jgi:archaellum component FlaC